MTDKTKNILPMTDNTPFIFDDHDIHNIIISELQLLRKAKYSFNYIYDKLVTTGNHLDVSTVTEIDLGVIKACEGKNYNWIAVSTTDIKGTIEFVIRQYGMHHTVFVKRTTNQKFRAQTYYEYQYACFTFNTDTSSLDITAHDRLCEHPYIELNKIFPDLIKTVNENNIANLWNNYDFKRPSYCEIKTAFYNNTISSIDLLIFCCEELSCLHIELFAENEMFEMLKTLKAKDIIGEIFKGQAIINKILIDFPKEYGVPYYHGIGIEIIDAKYQLSFKDIYCLTIYYLENVQLLMSKD